MDSIGHKNRVLVRKLFNVENEKAEYESNVLKKPVFQELSKDICLKRAG